MRLLERRQQPCSRHQLLCCVGVRERLPGVGLQATVCAPAADDEAVPILLQLKVDKAWMPLHVLFPLAPVCQEQGLHLLGHYKSAGRTGAASPAVKQYNIPHCCMYMSAAL